MSYCCSNLNGWFDDLLNAGERIATDITRKSTPVGYGTVSTPPMFPPTYGAPAPANTMNLAPSAFMAMLPYLVIAGVGVYLLTNRGRR